ncbi:DUF3782 domain-containing protein [Cyanobacterium sp. DS4]|uniref:DUF3782 domain-containing protein n=1 Tax=Cyanobacterium sp. DS4 TaxID=2878255 RepID=UPI002E7FEBD8|nr:DUF3782 domain-containing protein [Cyanobacterium sp. Dongsha4]WVL02141.1 DUF3782 domain-containing protein [Cyanobacterium sp. Dongsha4]
MTTTADEVWKILAELAESQKESDHRLQEIERILKEKSLETDRRMRETDRQITRLSKEIGNLGGKWGRFVENMVAPACETLFVSRGIPVHQVSQRVKKKLHGRVLEIDILVTNQDHVLVVEVKSSLGVENVKELMDDLQEFREFFPEYSQKRVYGAVAGIEIEEGADKYAYRQGLFVLTQSGENVVIVNGDDFQLKTW